MITLHLNAEMKLNYNRSRHKYMQRSMNINDIFRE